jgi:hypothetical protein
MKIYELESSGHITRAISIGLTHRVLCYERDNGFHSDTVFVVEEEETTNLERVAIADD